MEKVARKFFLQNCKLRRMKMPTLVAKEAESMVDVKIIIIQEEEAEADLIK